MLEKDITIITGLSGSGKSTAIAAFEDSGFYCVDNMPVELLPKFLELPFATLSDLAGLVFGMDLREINFMSKYPKVFDSIMKSGVRLRVLFFEAEEEVLLRRFSQTRRHHPLSPNKGILQGIRAEKTKLAHLRKTADRIIDTSKINPHELKAVILKLAREKTKISSMRINIQSFGFKHGIPGDADLIMDVRFIDNPYFVPELREFDGETTQIKDFVLSRPQTRVFLKKYMDLLDYLLPLYEKEGKSYLTLAFGCTGGRHRSVAIAWEVYKKILNMGMEAEIIHRDKDR